MDRALISVNEKIQVLPFIPESNSIRAAATHFSTGLTVIQPSQTKKCMTKESFLVKKMTSNRRACSIHSGPVVQHEHLEREIFDHILEQRKTGVAVFINAINAKSLAVNSSFQDRDHKKLQRCVYSFMAHWKISCRIITLTGQKLNRHWLLVREAFFKRSVLSLNREDSIKMSRYRILLTWTKQHFSLKQSQNQECMLLATIQFKYAVQEATVEGWQSSFPWLPVERNFFCSLFSRADQVEK